MSKLWPNTFSNFKLCWSYISNVKETPARLRERVQEFTSDKKEMSFNMDDHNKNYYMVIFVTLIVAL